MRAPLAVRAIPGITFRAWLTPPPLGTRTRQADETELRGFDHVWQDQLEWHEIGNGPVVLCLHGWGGRPAQMAPMAKTLADAGYRVVVPVLPGAAGSPSTDIKKVAEVVRSIVESLDQPEAIVSHSFSAMALRLVSPSPQLMVFFAPLLAVGDALGTFAERLALFPWARIGLRRRLSAWDPELWPIVASSSPDHFPGSDILVVHDPDDTDTSFSIAADWAHRRPNTVLVAARGTGHAGILADRSAIEHAVRFLTDRQCGASRTANAEPTPCLVPDPRCRGGPSRRRM